MHKKYHLEVVMLNCPLQGKWLLGIIPQNCSMASKQTKICAMHVNTLYKAGKIHSGETRPTKDIAKALM